MKKRILHAACAAAPALLFHAAAHATPLAFDCDVPPNHFSSVSQKLEAAPAVSGEIELKEMRSGTYLPVAGVLLSNPDNSTDTGFQLVAASPQARQFDLVLNRRTGGRAVERTKLGQIDAGGPIPFVMRISGSGKITLSVGSSTFNADFVPLPSSTAKIFCSTAQFKFSDLSFSSGDVPATGH